MADQTPQHHAFPQRLKDLGIVQDERILPLGSLHDLAMSSGPDARDLRLASALSAYDDYLAELEAGLDDLVRLNVKLHTALGAAIAAQEIELQIVRQELERARLT